MVSKRLIFKAFALFSLQQFGKVEKAPGQREGILFFFALAATLSLFVNLLFSSVVSVGRLVFPNYLFIISMYVLVSFLTVISHVIHFCSAVFYLLLFRLSGWPFLKPTDPANRIASSLKGVLYSVFEAVIVVLVMPYATVSHFKVLLLFSLGLIHFFLACCVDTSPVRYSLCVRTHAA